MAGWRLLTGVAMCLAIGAVLMTRTCSDDAAPVAQRESAAVPRPQSTPQVDRRVTASRTAKDQVLDEPVAGEQAPLVAGAMDRSHDPGESVDVQVIDASTGTPIEGVAVSRKALTKREPEYVGVTDPEGRLRCRVARTEAVALRIEKAAYLAEWTAALEAGASVRVALRSAAELSLSVCDAQGTPIPGVTSVLIDQAGDGGRAKEVARSSADGGSHRIDVPDSGAPLDLTVRSQGWRTRRLSIPTFGRGSRSETVELQPADVVRGVVTDAVSGEPIAGVAVTGGGGTSRTDASGEFAHAAGELQLDPTNNFLWFNHAEFCERVVHLETPAPTRLEVQLERALSVHLVVLDRAGSANLEGTVVETIPTRARATRRPVRPLDGRPGEFEIAGLTRGEWYLGNASSSDGRNTPFALKVDGGTRGPLVVELLPRVEISAALVIGPDETPAEGFCIVNEAVFRMQYLGSQRDPHTPSFDFHWNRRQIIRLDASGRFRAPVSPGRVVLSFVKNRWNHNEVEHVIRTVDPLPADQDLGRIRLGR